MSAQPAALGRGLHGPRPARAPRRRSRRLIRRETSRRVVPYVVAGVILAAGVIAGVLLEQVMLAQSAFKLQRIQERLQSAEAERQELLLEAAKLESPGRIEHFARTRIGMIDAPPAQVQYIVANVQTSAQTSPSLSTVDAEAVAGVSNDYLQEAAP